MGLLYGLSVFAVVASPLPWWLRAFVAAAVLVGAALTPTASVTRLRVGENGGWTLWRADQEETGLTLLPSTVATSWLILLHFRDGAGRFRAVPLLPDSLPPDGFRRLTVRLRIAPPGEAADGT
ncbi:hypothetical protein MoryE10_18110 [Methylogaea oryzae]|uniref:Toxin CptA n=2 Tax=Methylogaea oryzae TaxID=1295382 RepID=A0A8D5AML3_9GAMM|nr:hypothetical protein MoryE10_18110 [Methylogaea oryzae]